jgi:hypothetical protein
MDYSAIVLHFDVVAVEILGLLAVVLVMFVVKKAIGFLR